MRRLLLTLIILAILVAGVIAAKHFAESNTRPYLSLPMVEGKVIDSRYVITVSVPGERNKTIVFSPNRTVISSKRIDLLQSDAAQELVGMKMSDVEACFGQPHADVGSGLVIPAYITEDGYLISIHIDDQGLIDMAYKLDLLSNTDWQQGDGLLLEGQGDGFVVPPMNP